MQVVPPALDRLMWASMPEIVASIPLPFMHAPKHIAQMMRYTVLSIPDIPLEVTSWFTSGTPVSSETVL